MILSCYYIVDIYHINTKNLRRFITVKAHCSWHTKTAKITWFILVLHWGMDVIYDFYYIHGPMEY